MLRLDRVHRSSIAGVAALALLACSGGGGDGGATPPPGACPQVAALEVVSSTPASGQEGVSVGTAITVRFNTCIDPASLTSETATLRRSTGSVVPGALSWDAAQNAIVFDPASPLAFGADYVFSVLGLRGAHGEALVPAMIPFRTRLAPETVPPTTTATPPAGRYNAPQSVALECEDGATGTGCVATYYTLDGSAPTSSSTRYLDPIDVDRSLTIRFFSVDGDGNAEPPRSAAYVIDTDPPAVVSTEPAAGAVGVRVDAPVRIVFDEPMASALPSISPIVSGITILEPGSLAVVRTPSEPYECATTYQVTVPATATDVAGNPLPEPYTFAFTTSSDCDAPRTTASLASGAWTAAQAVTLTCEDGDEGSGCSRIVYTLDGSVPSFSPPNGIVVAGGVAGPIAVGEGETVLRFRAEDAAGHLEAIRERRYSVSTRGFTWLATSSGLARGIGPVPERFVELPFTGRTSALARDPVDGRLYRATEVGLAYSDDGITTTVVPLKRPDASWGVGATSVAAHAGRVYVGTQDGLFVSRDGGATFTVREFGPYEANRVLQVAVSGTDVYVATEARLHVSHDRFRTWTSRFGATADVAVDGETVYAVARAAAGVPRAIHVSHDRGATWAAPALPDGAGEAYSVAFQGDAVYVGTDGGVAISLDRGATFTSLVALDGNPVTDVAAGDGYVYAASKVLYSSAPSAFWVASTPTGPFERRRIPGGDRDVDVAAILVEGSDVHVAAHPSWWRSRDHGATFALADFPGRDTKRVVAAGEKVYAAVHDSTGWGGLLVSSDRGATFTYRGVESGLPDDSIDDLFLDGTTLYAGTWRGLAITQDDGATWNVRTQANSGLWSNDASAVWASGSTVWVAASTKVQRSTNGGQTFADVKAVEAEELAVWGPSVFLGLDDGVEVSNDGGATFVHRGPADGLSGTYVRDLDVAPGGTLFVGTTNALDASTDGGVTFHRLSLPPSIYPYSVSACGGVLFAGAGEVAISTDGGATFTVRTSSDGLPGSFQDGCYAAP